MHTSIVTYQKFHGRPEGSVGSSIIRGKWLAEAWPDATLWTNGQKADAMIFQKAYWKAMMEDFPGPKILDLCDPDWMSGELKLTELAQHVQAITCSTEALTEVVRKFVPYRPVETVPDRLNLNYFTRKKEHVAKATRVVYFGFKHNADIVLPQVLSSLGRYGLELLVVSNKPFTAHATYGTTIKNVQWTHENAYNDIQYGDIAINPPYLQGSYRYKSNNKTLIAWGLGLPVANTLEEIERFLDPLERQKEASQRWAEIQRDWDIKQSVAQYEALLAKITTP